MNALLAVLTLHAVITGGVYGPGGKPIANVRVTASRIETPREQNARIASGMLERKPAATATTDDNGTFALDTKSSGMFELLVAPDDYVPQRIKVLADDSVAIALRSAAMRTSRVTANGKPVANAIVVARADSRGQALRAVKTADDGTFALPNPKLWAAAIIVLHPDFAPLQRTNELDLTLTPGKRVTGKVLAPNGAPVANARIFVEGWPLATSRDDGTFVLPHVADETKSIEAFAPGMHGSAQRANDTIINLAAARTIAGTVRDAKREPLAGAVIYAWPIGGSEFDVAVADEKGNYLFDQCDAAQYSLDARATPDFDFGQSTRVNLRKQPAGRADFVAKPAAFVRGVVLDARKRPVGGARVINYTSEEPRMYMATKDGAEVMSGPDGRFRISPNESGASLLAIHTNYAIGISEPIDLTNGPPRKPVTITLPDGIEVRGTVTDSEHHPIAGAAVLAVEDPAAATPYPLDGFIAGDFAQAMIESGADGAFSIHLNRAPHDLVVWKEGYAAFRKVGMTPDGSRLDIVLSHGVAIRGRVMRRSGKPPHDGSLRVFSDEGTARYAELQPDATFEIGSLAPGDYTIAFESPSGESAPRKVHAPADDVVLELASMSEIRGRVIDKATRTPVQSYRVSIEARDFYGLSVSVVDGQPFAIDAPPGFAKVHVLADGYLPESTEVTVEEGNIPEVTIALSRGRAVRGRVTAASGTPIAEASVNAGDDSRFGHAMTDDDGEFELHDLPRDAVTIVVERSGFVTRRVVAGERDTNVDVVLSRGRKVTGRVVTTNGEPVAEASVYANSAAHAADSQTASAGENGTFEMEGLSDGRYTFIGSKQGYSAGKVEDVDVTAAAPIVITLSNDKPKAALHGTVDGFAGSAAIYGVVVAETEGEGSAQGVINRDGTFRVENAFAGEVTVRASAGGLRGDMQSTPEHVTLAPGADVGVNLKFRTDITIRGVVTEDGTPATGRTVAFGDVSGNSNASATTDAAGAYEIVGIVPGDYTVSVGTQRGPFVTSLQVTDSATFDIRIELSRIEGRVVDEDGAPVAGATIALNDRDTRMISDASGAFSFSLPSGKYTFVASKRGYGETRFEAETGGAPTTVTLARGDELRVRVVDARDGTTLAGYVVALAPSGNTVIANSRGTSSDGTARIALAAGSYRIAASADGYASGAARAEVPSSTEIRVALTPGGKLIIHSTKSEAVIAKLVLPGGEEYVQCHCNGVSAIRMNGPSAIVEHVAPARYTLQLIDAKGKVIASTTVSIAEGQVTSAEL